MLSWSAIAHSPSKSFAAAAIAFCVGIALPAALSIDQIIVLLAVGAGAVVLLKAREPRLIAVCVLMATLGLYRVVLDTPAETDTTTADFVGHSHLVGGEVVAEPDRSATSQSVTLGDVRIDYTQLGGERFLPIEGKILAWIPGSIPVSYGDRVSFTCELQAPEPFEGFAYDAYLASRGIYALCFRPEDINHFPDETPSIVAYLLRFKHAAVERLGMIVPEPHASFLAGLLFGGSSGLSDDLQEDFSRTGTSHILAASGFNVSLFSATLLAWLLQLPIGRRRSALIAALFLLAYVCVAGATAAVVRAGVMAGIVLVGTLIQRKAFVPNVFLLAAVLMLAFEPAWVRDIGFQLSFVATSAIVWLAPRWEKVFEFVPEMFGLRTALSGSLAATVLTLPIMLWHFGSVSIISPIVNLLVLPFVPLLMAIAVIALIIGSVSLTLGVIVALPAWAIASVLLHVIVWHASLPYASISVEASHIVAGISLSVIIFFLWRSARRATARARS